MVFKVLLPSRSRWNHLKVRGGSFFGLHQGDTYVWRILEPCHLEIDKLTRHMYLHVLYMSISYVRFVTVFHFFSITYYYHFITSTLLLFLLLLLLLYYIIITVFLFIVVIIITTIIVDVSQNAPKWRYLKSPKIRPF